jgi:hypothetical protein
MTFATTSRYSCAKTACSSARFARVRAAAKCTSRAKKRQVRKRQPTNRRSMKRQRVEKLSAGVGGGKLLRLQVALLSQREVGGRVYVGTRRRLLLTMPPQQTTTPPTSPAAGRAKRHGRRRMNRTAITPAVTTPGGSAATLREDAWRTANRRDIRRKITSRLAWPSMATPHSRASERRFAARGKPGYRQNCHQPFCRGDVRSSQPPLHETWRESRRCTAIAPTRAR